MDRDNLHSYQRAAVQFILRHARCQLWLDMGLGKTISTLTALADLFDAVEVSRVLVVAPLRVAHRVWPEEIRTWRHVRWLTHRVIAGTPTQRLAQLKGEEHIHIINYDLLPWLSDQFKGNWPYDCVVADEFSRLKNRSTRRWKALSRHLGRIQRLVGLTGTPAANGLLDLWAPAYLLDQGQRLGRTLTGYRQRWFIPLDANGWTWRPVKHAEQEIKGRLADITLAMTSADYLTLPPKISNVLTAPLPAACRAQYRQLEREMYLQLQTATVAVANSGALITKCAQYANGAMYVDGEPAGGERAWEEVHRIKLDMLDEIIEEAEGQPVLVAYAFRSDLTRLKKRYPQARDVYEKGDVIGAWNRGEVSVLLGHPASMGHGLNLQGGGNILVWFGLPWSLELYEQTTARLYRQGQARPTYVHHLVLTGTVDEQVLEVLQRKRTLQESLIEAMKKAA